MPEPLSPEPEFPTLTALLQHRERTAPSRSAYTFLADGEHESSRLTNAELGARARTIAAQLAGLAAPGDRALLLFSPGLGFMEAFFGCLFAGIIAVPSYPPKRNRPDPRLATIVGDSGAKLVLTDSAILSEIEPRLKNTPSLRALTWIATDTFAEEPTSPPPSPPEIAPDDLAFLQYTSGSTADPKGVMVSHANLLHNLADLDHGWNHQTDSVMVTWLPIFHDMGLIYGALMPLFKGFLCVMMPPASFLQRPVRWLEAISQFKGTHSSAPNFAYDLCVASTTAEQRSQLDLSSWYMSLNAAEPVRAHTLSAFNEAFAPAGLSPKTVKPGFGLAEATLKVTALPREEPVTIVHLDSGALARHELLLRSADDPAATAIIGCGWGQVDNHTLIVDPESKQPCPPDRVGEIWFAGPSVAQGYWRRTEATQETFQATLADGTGPWMRTGDLGFARGREVFVTGRVKDLIILRGLNHYPQDIELTIERAHPSIRAGCSAAFPIDTEHGESLAIVAEVERTSLRRFDQDRVVAALREAVTSEHELAIHTLVFIKPASIPKTSSGKIQRSLARRRLLAQDFKSVATWVATPEFTDSAPGLGSDLEQFIGHAIARILKVDVSQIDPNAPFASQGLDSLAAVELSGALETHLGRRLAPTLAYDFPHVRALASHLAETDARLFSGPPTLQPHDQEPIAVVGVGCRFPGAASVADYWNLLISGRNAISPVPPDRWDSTQFLAPAFGGFLQSIDLFDTEFFGLSAREADLMDPQQRLLLETSWEALESAGIAPAELAGTNTGVFVGISTHDYRLLLARDPEGLSPHAGTGNALSIAANRLSYSLDLKGPSLAVDTACSSSLVALHHAGRSIREGESDLALVGGVNLILAPDVSESFAAAGMLAPDGFCKTFDADANGYVRGEGAGVVVLKRLSLAQRDGDNILALLQGSAVNQDGRSNGLTAPNGPAQQAVITAALRDAGVAPAQISFVESHGTGTALGDPIEFNALQTVLSTGRATDSPCQVGAVKTQLGHLEAAAGIAGFIKTVLALHHEKIPANLNFQRANPHLTNATPPTLGLPTSPQIWDGTERFAGVSSFGFGGTNAHVVLRSAPASVEATTPATDQRPEAPYLLSARDPAALAQLVAEHGAYLEKLAANAWPDASFTSTTGRTAFDLRIAVVAPDACAAAALLAGAEIESPPVRAPRIAFLFPGQGSLYAGAGRELRESCPAFAQALAKCRELTLQIAGWDVVEAIDDETKIGQTEFAQVALFALEYSLAKTWQSWGIQPVAVAGHSVGEYAAAVIAGIMKLEAALKLLINRARLMGELGDTGAMAAILAPAATVESLAHAHGAEVGAYNSERQTVITGSAAAVAASSDAAAKAELRVVQLTVKQGYHSTEMDPMLPAFRSAAAATELHLPDLPFVSSHTGKLADHSIATVDYWMNQIRQPVRWAAAARTLAQTESDLIIEVGPRNLLSGLSAQSWPDQPVKWLTSLQPDSSDWTTLLRAATRAWTRSAPVDWVAIHQGFTQRRIPLPTYPFQRHRHWFSDTNTIATELNDETAVRLAADPQLSAADKSAIPALLAALRRIQGNTDPAPSSCTHEILWQPQPRESEPTPAAGSWLIIGSHADLAAGLADTGQTITIAPHYQTGSWTNVLHLAGAGSTRDECHRLLKTVQSVAAAPAAARLHIITRGAVASTPMEGRTLQLPHAAIWGMGLSFGLEHPERWGGLIDLPPNGFADEKAAVAAELLTDSAEDQVALRPGRYVPRLKSSEVSSDGPITLATDASFWITGGLGGVGLQTARWLITQGARRIILSGRRTPDASIQHTLSALRRLDAEVDYIALDVTDAAAVTALLDQAEADGHPVRGIIHAAGVMHNQPLAEVTPESMDAVLHPKVEGGRVLHEATVRRELDFLVFFSSIASVWGSKWQLHYSAANRFLDALAVHRRATALPALSINWGPWAGGGMAGDEEQALLGRMGITPLDSTTQLDLLGTLLQGEQAQNVIAQVDWDTFRGLVEMQRPKPLLANLGSMAAPATNDPLAGPSDLVTTWSELDNEARDEAIITWLQQELATVLGRKSDRLPDSRQGFFDLGLDSLLAMEFRNRLVKAIGRSLPATLAFDHGNIRALAEYLISKLWSAPSALKVAVPQNVTPSPLPDIADGASDEDIDDALNARLARLEALTREE